VLQEFFLHLVGYACTQVDAHSTLAGGQFVQLLFFGHRCTAFATGKDDCLYLFRDGELRTQGGCCGLERGYSRGDMIAHIVPVEEIHLFLYRSVDTGIAGMQADNELAPVVKLFHQGELLVEIHIGRTAHGCSLLGAVSQLFRDEAPGIKDQVCLLQHPAAADGNQFRIARPGSDYLDMSLPAYGFIHSHGKSIFVAFAQASLLFFK